MRSGLLSRMILAAGIALAVTGAAAQEPAKPRAQRAAARPVPEACTAKAGVERKICAECEGTSVIKRIGCEQRVFWTTCKGKRLINDPYCVTHQDRGPPAPASAPR